jgi:hypothetical protein
VSRLGRAVSRADDAHPSDPSVALGEVCLLLDYERAIRAVDVEAVTNSLAVGEAVAVQMRELVDLVRLLEPCSEKQRDHSVSSGGLPTTARSEPAKVDVWVQHFAHPVRVLVGQRMREVLTECGRLGHRLIIVDLSTARQARSQCRRAQVRRSRHTCQVGPVALQLRLDVEYCSPRFVGEVLWRLPGGSPAMVANVGGGP